MKRKAIIAVCAIVLLAGIIAGVDYLVWRYRLWANRSPYGSCLVTRYYAIPQKNNRVVFAGSEIVPETCVNALVPHPEYKPCWYLKRHTEEQIEE